MFIAILRCQLSMPPIQQRVVFKLVRYHVLVHSSLSMRVQLSLDFPSHPHLPFRLLSNACIATCIVARSLPIHATTISTCVSMSSGTMQTNQHIKRQNTKACVRLSFLSLPLPAHILTTRHPSLPARDLQCRNRTMIVPYHPRNNHYYYYCHCNAQP